MTDNPKAELLRSRRENDKKLKELNRTHEILNDATLSQDEKFFALITECKFGRMRAQQLVYGKVKYENSYQGETYIKNIERYYRR